MKLINIILNIKVRLLVLSIIGLSITNVVSAQLPKAKEIAAEMRVGWNMGNTLEAICGETAWGGALTTQKLIDSVKAAGFNSVRLPVAWFCHSDTITNVIDDAWIARVKEVVDYCINDDLYVIMNIHWDGGWLENHVNIASESRVNDRQWAYWTQIATYFKDYDEHLLFAGANEPNVEDAAGMAVLMTYHQTFIDAVRSTGGNNSSRTLIVQGPSTDIDKTNNLMKELPSDEIADRLIVEVHYYTPYQFTIMEKDADWGKVFYYWGKDYHSATETDRNANWGEEADMEKYFGLMKTKFVEKSIPVIIGEFGAYKRKLGASSNQELHNASIDYFNGFVVKTAIDNGIIPFYWTTNMGLFNRSTGEVVDQSLMDALMKGAEEGYYPVTVGSIPASSINIYPNPSASAFTLKVNSASDIERVVIFDVMGKVVESIESTDNKTELTLGQNLKPNLYNVVVYEKNNLSSYKIFKMNE